MSFILLMLDLIDTANKDTIVIRSKSVLKFSLCKYFFFSFYIVDSALKSCIR